MSEVKPSTINRKAYQASLEKFDAAICEAIAVSQASANRLSELNVGYASHVFTRMCGAGTAMIRAVPLSRWVRADFEDWSFGAVAGHARALLDGYLLFNYLIEPSKTENESKARINVMHLNDCTRRIELHTNLGNAVEVAGFEEQRSELRERLMGNDFFGALAAPVQKQCLNGRFLMIDSRDEMLAKVGFAKGQFHALYDLWSQHLHILPMSFYRIEPNGRGTGIENDTDRAYIAQALELGSALLEEATDCMVEQFPDVAESRKGTKSIFSPGPRENLPKKVKSVSRAVNDNLGLPPFAESGVMAAMKRAFNK